MLKKYQTATTWEINHSALLVLYSWTYVLHESERELPLMRNVGTMWLQNDYIEVRLCNHKIIQLLESILSSCLRSCLVDDNEVTDRFDLGSDKTCQSHSSHSFLSFRMWMKKIHYWKTKEHYCYI